MQCAAMSAPQARSAPRLRATTGFVPIESVEAASSRRSSRGWSPAKAPKPRAPVDSTAVRRRSTIPSAVASETPAAAYVRSSLTRRVYDLLRRASPTGTRSGTRPGSPGTVPRDSGHAKASSEKPEMSDQGLGVQLRAPLRPAGEEADDRVAHLDARPVALLLEQLRQRRRLRLGLVREQVQLA